MTYEEISAALRETETNVARENRKLKLLRELVTTWNIEYNPGISKLNELIMGCIESHGGAATLTQIRLCLAAQKASVKPQHLSAILTKNEKLDYNREKRMWEIVK